MLILMGICISLFVTFSQTLLRDLSFWQRGVTTQGEVTQVTDIVCRRYDKNRQLTSRGSSVNVRFHDLHQHIHEVSFAECNTNFYGLHPGDSITIVYLPDQPEVATLKDQLGLGFLPNSLYFPASIVCTTILFIGILFWPFVRGRLLRR